MNQFKSQAVFGPNGGNITLANIEQQNLPGFAVIQILPEERSLNEHPQSKRCRLSL